MFQLCFIIASMLCPYFLWKAGRLRRMLLFSLMYLCLVSPVVIFPKTYGAGVIQITTLPAGLWFTLSNSVDEPLFNMYFRFALAMIYNCTLYGSVFALIGRMDRRQKKLVFWAIVVSCWPLLFYGPSLHLLL